MLLYVFFRFLHFVAIFGVTAAVIIENLAVKPSISKEDAINLAKISLIDNVSLLLTLMAGYTLWFWVGKPSEFYTENPVFLAKLIIFSIILVFGFFSQHSTIDLIQDILYVLSIEPFSIRLIRFLM